MARQPPPEQPSPATTVALERWPSEIPLLVLVALASAAIWLLLAISIVGAIYGALIAVALFLTHVAFVGHVRGSAVRLGPEQLPELWERVRELATRAGLAEPPAAYVMQQGGALNALATRFLRADLMVLYSDLLEACGDDGDARDMIIGHELGHLKAGHLRWAWLLAPGRLVPFLGGAYSRARELTCDRFGAALVGDRSAAVRGLAILAAGGAHARRIDLSSFVEQRRDLDTGWMTLAKWLSGYPPLAERVAALDPSLTRGHWIAQRGPVRAALILAAVLLVPSFAGMVAVGVVAPALRRAMEEIQPAAGGAAGDDGYGYGYEEDEAPPPVPDAAAAAEQVGRDAAALAALVQEFEARNGIEIEDLGVIYQLWAARHPDRPPPLDPFDGYRYGFSRLAGGFSIWSSGPDQEARTDDDIVIEFARP